MKLRAWSTIAMALSLGPACRDDGATTANPEMGTATAGEDGATGSNDDHPADDDTGGEDSDAGETGAPDPQGEGPADFPLGRKIRRLTADQYAASLTTATGQSWPDYPLYAGAMGKADFAEITVHDRTISVTFDKFIHDAARYSCRAAVEVDASEGGDVILRHATLQDSTEAATRANVAYLMLRFLARNVDPDDAQVDPYAGLVVAPTEGLMDDDKLKERWAAVCVALATHADFIAY